MMSDTMATPYPGTDSDSRGTPSPLLSPGLRSSFGSGPPSPGLYAPGPLSPGASALAILEHDLALAISDLVAMGDGARQMMDSERRLADINKNVYYLRGKMRHLRRWRSGVETGSDEQIDEMTSFVQKSQFKIYESRITQLLDHVEELDISSGALEDAEEPEIVKLRADVECLLPVLQERLRSVDKDTESVTCLSGFREDLMEIHETVLTIRVKLTKSIEKSKRKSAPPVMRSSSISSQGRQYSKIEKHPLINHLLRMLSRIRKLMMYFRHGYHKPAEGSSIPCVDNDTDVLARQIEKIAKWRKCKNSFTIEDLENMETIVSAMERHLRSDVDLGKTLECDSGMECTSNTCPVRAPELANQESESTDDNPNEPPPGDDTDKDDESGENKSNGDLTRIDLNFNEKTTISDIKKPNGAIDGLDEDGALNEADERFI